MKYLASYLHTKRVIASASAADLKQLLFNLWFKMYKRDRQSRAADSSAFEHVFVGEISKDFKSGEMIIKGFHNWIQIYMQETKGGKLNYKGYKRPRARGLNSLKHAMDEEQVNSKLQPWPAESICDEDNRLNTFSLVMLPRF